MTPTVNYLDFTDNYVRSMPSGRCARFAELDALLVAQGEKVIPPQNTSSITLGECGHPVEGERRFCDECRRQRLNASSRRYQRTHREQIRAYHRKWRRANCSAQPGKRVQARMETREQRKARMTNHPTPPAAIAGRG